MQNRLKPVAQRRDRRFDSAFQRTLRARRGFQPTAAPPRPPVETGVCHAKPAEAGCQTVRSSVWQCVSTYFACQTGFQPTAAPPRPPVSTGVCHAKPAEARLPNAAIAGLTVRFNALCVPDVGFNPRRRWPIPGMVATGNAPLRKKPFAWMWCIPYNLAIAKPQPDSRFPVRPQSPWLHRLMLHLRQPCRRLAQAEISQLLNRAISGEQLRLRDYEIHHPSQ